MLADMTIKQFLEETASNSPVPGGGSVAALSAAISAALTQMVANLTVGRKDYQQVQNDAEEVLVNAKKGQEFFVDYMDKDSDSFNKVMGAFRLPKATEEEKTLRSSAVQEAYKEAALVPLETAREAYKMMDMIQFVVEKGNKNAASDGLVAAMLCRTAVLSALYNVKINLSSIKDRSFKEKINTEVDTIEKNVKLREEEILSKVNFY